MKQPDEPKEMRYGYGYGYLPIAIAGKPAAGGGFHNFYTKNDAVTIYTKNDGVTNYTDNAG